LPKILKTSSFCRQPHGHDEVFQGLALEHVFFAYVHYIKILFLVTANKFGKEKTPFLGVLKGYLNISSMPICPSRGIWLFLFSPLLLRMEFM
jgi:hypothetical protein